jgi:nitrous oxidase accessory protein NosD
MKYIVPSTFVVMLTACASTTDRPPDVRLRPGQSIQAAIDACEPGAVIHLAEGVYLERIVIEKPITLVGSGWEHSIVGDDAPLAPNVAESFGAGSGADARVPSASESLPRVVPTITIHGTDQVTIRGLRIRGPNTLAAQGTVGDETLVLVDGAQVLVSDCAIVGPSMNGIAILDGSDARIERCLVAALWGTGVQVRNSRNAAAGPPARVEIVECDVRNCFHRCITTTSSEVTIERSRISGSAWHGIRYDDCSPTIRANQIFGNARAGIYASGETAATVSDNVFWRNALSGISCWKTSKDSIEANTFVGNLREAVGVLGQAFPKIQRNLFLQNEVAVAVNNLEGEPYPGDASSPAFSKNHFADNKADFQVAGQVESLPGGNESKPRSTTSSPKRSAAVVPDSYAQNEGIGAMDPTPLTSRFPLQPEESAMIPDDETRDFSKWKRQAP